METVKKIIKKGIEIESGIIFQILSEVSGNGDIMIIKSDGLRDSLTYSVIVSSHQNKFLPIRFDSEDIKDAIFKVLNEYGNFIND